MLQQKSTEQIRADIHALQKALSIPNLPKDEEAMHSSLIAKLLDELARRSASQNESPLHNERIIGSARQREDEAFSHALSNDMRESLHSHVVQGSAGYGSRSRTNDQPTTPPPAMPRMEQSRTILAGGFEKTTGPITAQISPANNSEKYNPSITITWSDGYTVTVDEAAAISRFKSTFRDTLALKCVSEQKYNKMWRWDTPWRCAGFYQALMGLDAVNDKALQELGYSRPTERQKEVFDLILEKALAWKPA